MERRGSGLGRAFLTGGTAWLLALGGCEAPQTAIAPHPAGLTFVLAADSASPAPAASPVPSTSAASSARPREGASPAPSAPVKLPSPVASAPSAPPAPDAGGGDGGNGGGSALVPLDPRLAHLTLPGGQVVQLPPADAVALPAGATGDVILDEPGHVATTIAADGSALTVHPTTAEPTPATGTAVHVTGTVQPPTPGIVVTLVLPGGTPGATASPDASGNFAMDVMVPAATPALLLARTADPMPTLGLARISLDPATAPPAATVSVSAPGDPVEILPGAFRLLGSNDTPSTLPPAPQGMHYDLASLQVLESQPTPWVMELVQTPGVSLPTYPLQGFTQLALMRAASDDHQIGTMAVGPFAAGKPLPAMLGAPLLSTAATQRPAPGQRLAWQAVAGNAVVYVARITSRYVADPALWEGATTGTSLQLPGNLAALAGDVDVRVDAWDESDVTLRSLASLPAVPRDLRVPAALTGPTGRHSWATRSFYSTP